MPTDIPIFGIAARSERFYCWRSRNSTTRAGGTAGSPSSANRSAYSVEKALPGKLAVPPALVFPAPVYPVVACF